MRLFQKPIFIGFLPNLLQKDVMLSLSFCLPWNWSKLQKGTAVQKAEKNIQDFFQISNAITFDSGRSSLYFALKALGIEKGDEVAVQAYTCLVVSNAITLNGAQPLYIDIAENYSMDPLDLERKITPRTKVLILQHTFGIPANLEPLLALAKKYNLKVVEDCAHTFGGMYRGQLLGTFGDMGMLSFGTEKSLSCGRGGALITKNEILAKKLREYQKNLPHIEKKKILQQFFTNSIFAIAKPLYNFWIGKGILALVKKLNLSTRIIEDSEKRGESQSGFPAKLPNAYAQILLLQLSEIRRFNDHRMTLTKYYLEHIKNPNITIVDAIKNIQEGEYLVRFPMCIQNPKKFLQKAKDHGIILGDWYSTVVAPADGILEKMAYKKGTCLRAEQIANQSINLPTSIHISLADAKRIATFINTYAN